MGWLYFVLVILLPDLICLFVLSRTPSLYGRRGFWAALILCLPIAGALVFAITLAATRDLENAMAPIVLLERGDTAPQPEIAETKCNPRKPGPGG